MAVSGMSPTVWLFGIFKIPVGMVASFTWFAAQELLMLTVNCRRHRPSWMTSGMLLPTGTLERVKVPSYAVVVVTSGLPLTSAPHVVHCCAVVSLARGVNAVTV